MSVTHEITGPLPAADCVTVSAPYGEIITADRARVYSQVGKMLDITVELLPVDTPEAAETSVSVLNEVRRLWHDQVASNGAVYAGPRPEDYTPEELHRHRDGMIPVLIHDPNTPDRLTKNLRNFWEEVSRLEAAEDRSSVREEEVPFFH